jgi:hypothetical protein
MKRIFNVMYFKPLRAAADGDNVKPDIARPVLRFNIMLGSEQEQSFFPGAKLLLL